MKPDSEPGFWRARWRSLICAGRGAALVFRTQANARIHLLATIAVVVSGIVFRVSRGEWCLLLLATGLVWAAEAANTALEVLADRVNRERDEAIRQAKDIAAGAVLLAAITAATVGILVLGPYVWTLVRKVF